MKCFYFCCIISWHDDIFQMQICSCTFRLNYTPHQQVKVHRMSYKDIMMWTQSSFLAITHHSLPWALQFSYPELLALCHSLFSVFSACKHHLESEGMWFQGPNKEKEMTWYRIILLWFFWASALCDDVWNKYVTLKYQGPFSQITVTAAMSRKNNTTTTHFQSIWHE